MLLTQSPGAPCPDRIASCVLLQTVPDETAADCRTFLAHWRPDICIWHTGHLRPTLLSTARQDRIPMILVDAAEDALQENFVSAYRAFNRLRGEDLAAWVLRIVSNTCRDMLHARKSRPTVSLDPVPDLITEIKGGQHPPGGGCWKSPQGCWPLGRWPAWHSVGEPDAIKAFGVDRPLLCPGNFFSNPSVLNHINDAAKRKSRRNE